MKTLDSRPNRDVKQYLNGHLKQSTLKEYKKQELNHYIAEPLRFKINLRINYITCKNILKY